MFRHPSPAAVSSFQAALQNLYNRFASGGSSMVRTPHDHPALEATAADIRRFLQRPELDSELIPEQQLQVIALLQVLAGIEIETGYNAEAVIHSSQALAILQSSSYDDPISRADILHTRAVANRELEQYDNALSDFRTILAILLGSGDPADQQADIGLITARQDCAIVYLRMEPITEGNLQEAIHLLDQALRQSVRDCPPDRPHLVYVRVHSYLALAHTLYLEKFADSEDSEGHSAKAYAALRIGLKTARQHDDQLDISKRNQDVATLCFHAARYFNFVGDYPKAFRYAVDALAIRAEVHFRKRLKIDEVCSEMAKVWDKLSPGDRSALKDSEGSDVERLLGEIHGTLTADAGSGKPELGYCGKYIDTISGYLTDIHGATATPAPGAV